MTSEMDGNRAERRGARVVIGIALGCWVTAGAWADAPAGVDAPAARLEIVISELDSDRGAVVVVLLDSAAQFESEDAFFRADDSVPVRGGAARVVFDGVPHGTYAVKVFHDENSNGELDTNFVGYPSEGFGFSNDAMGKFGPPSFEQAAFAVDAGEHRIEITAR